MSDRHKIVDEFVGDTSTPIQWDSEEDRRLRDWFDDLHCPRQSRPCGSTSGFAGLRAESMFRVEGVARIVESAAQFDRVQKDEKLVCKMTNPAWVVLLTKIGGLITDFGGVLSHPAFAGREFGIPAVVGTRFAIQAIKTGQRVRVDGARGTVTILP